MDRPYVRYVMNQPSVARNHYHGLKEALPDLKAVAIFDRLDSLDLGDSDVRFVSWRRREIENYLCTQQTLKAYAVGTLKGEFVDRPLSASAEQDRRLAAMHDSIQEIENAMETLGRGSPWSEDSKVSDDFLTPLFQRYFEKLGITNLMNKKDFYELAEYVPLTEIDPEISEKLDAIAEVSSAAKAAQ